MSRPLPRWMIVAGVAQVLFVAAGGSVILMLIDGLSRRPTVLDWTINLLAPLAIAAMLLAGGRALWCGDRAILGATLYLLPVMIVLAIIAYGWSA